MQLESKQKAVTTDEDTIDILELLGILKNKLIWIITFAMLGAVIAYTYSSFFITPLYSATAVVYVNNKGNAVYVDTITTNELAISARLVPTYQAIVSTKTAMRRAIDERGIVGYTPEQLLGMVSTSADEDTGVFYITVTGEDQFYVADIANAVADVSTLEIARYVEGATVNVIDYALMPEQQASPNNSRNALLGFMVGAVLSAGVFLLAGFMDASIKKTEEFTKALGAPVLGIIPNLDFESRSGHYRNKTHQGENKI